LVALGLNSIAISFSIHQFLLCWRTLDEKWMKHSLRLRQNGARRYRGGRLDRYIRCGREWVEASDQARQMELKRMRDEGLDEYILG
jgi:hypothetical protein